MGDKMNIPLLLLDFLILLPVSLLRLGIIYMYGSRYNIPNFRVLDVMMHSNEPNFNKGRNIIMTEKGSIQDAVIEMVDPDNPRISKVKETVQVVKEQKIDHITNVINNMMSESNPELIEDSSDHELPIINTTNTIDESSTETETETATKHTPSIKFTEDVIVDKSNVDIFN